MHLVIRCNGQPNNRFFTLDTFPPQKKKIQPYSTRFMKWVSTHRSLSRHERMLLLSGFIWPGIHSFKAEGGKEDRCIPWYAVRNINCTRESFSLHPAQVMAIWKSKLQFSNSAWCTFNRDDFKMAPANNCGRWYKWCCRTEQSVQKGYWDKPSAKSKTCTQSSPFCSSVQKHSFSYLLILFRVVCFRVGTHWTDHLTLSCILHQTCLIKMTNDFNSGWNMCVNIWATLCDSCL